MCVSEGKLPYYVIGWHMPANDAILGFPYSAD